MKRRQKEILILVGAFALIWGVFTIVPFLNKKSLPQVPLKTEEKFGSMIFDKFYKDENNVISDSIVTANVDSITHLLVSHITDSRYHYKVVIVRSPLINAFALPGGYIVIFSSLIQYTDSPEELAAVLAHEIGHIEKHHTVNKILKDELFAILTSGKGGFATSFANKMGSSAFDRKSEAEADDFSFQLLLKCGISPKNTGYLFKRLKDSLGDETDVLELISSHPDLQSRINKSLNYQIPNNFKETKLNLNWELVRSIVTRYYGFQKRISD